MSKIILRCLHAKIFDKSVNFVDSVCNKNYPCVPTSKFCVQQKICSYVKNKSVLFCDVCNCFVVPKLNLNFIK